MHELLTDSREVGTGGMPAGFGRYRKGEERQTKDPEEIGNRDVGKGVNFYSFEKEIALGKQMAQEVERQAKIVDDPVMAEYVNRVGQNLVRDSDAINVFALPAGRDMRFTPALSFRSAF